MQIPQVSMDAQIVCGRNEAKIQLDLEQQQLLYQKTWQTTLFEATPLALHLCVASVLQEPPTHPHVMLSSVLSIPLVVEI